MTTADKLRDAALKWATTARVFLLQGRLAEAERALGKAEGLNAAIDCLPAEAAWKPWGPDVAPEGLFLVRSTTVPYGPVQDGAHVALAALGRGSKAGIWTTNGFWPWEETAADSPYSAGMFSHYAEIPPFDGDES
jgi:hypothetical protein